MQLDAAINDFAQMNLEVQELCALMWAVEVACDAVDRGSKDRASVDAAERAWATHQRLQSAWQELLRKKHATTGGS